MDMNNDLAFIQYKLCSMEIACRTGSSRNHSWRTRVDNLKRTKTNVNITKGMEAVSGNCGKQQLSTFR